MTEFGPQPGWIGMVEIPGPVGTAIRIGQYLNGDGFWKMEHVFVCTKASPSGCACPNHAVPVQIVEAAPGGSRTALLAKYYHRPITWLYPPTPEIGRDVADNALNMLGIPYSDLDYLALATHRLHIPAPGLRDYIADTGHMICSQFADEAARRAGWHLFKNVWEGYVTPGAIRRLAAAQAGAAR